MLPRSGYWLPPAVMASPVCIKREMRLRSQGMACGAPPVRLPSGISPAISDPESAPLGLNSRFPLPTRARLRQRVQRLPAQLHLAGGREAQNPQDRGEQARLSAARPISPGREEGWIAA